MSVYENIVFSAVGGFVVIAIQLFWNGVVPLFVQRFYHHEPSIGGKWNTTFMEKNKEYHEVVTLQQKGRRVYGQIVLKEEDAEDSVYKFDGTFKHLILTCNYCATDPSEYEQGVFALKYEKGKFRGQHVLLSKESEDLISSKYSWVR